MKAEQIGNSILFNGDCLEVMEQLIQSNVKVDFAFADLPYNETGNKWDSKIDHHKMFELLKQLCKEEAAMAFSGTFRFGVELFNAAPDLYKYDWVWEKDNGTNAPNVNLQPFRVHENIYIFGKGRVTNGKRTPMKYNPQKTEGKPYCQKSGRMSENWKGGLQNVVTNNESGLRHPKTIQYFCRDRGLHPTQKPVAMMEYLIKTYSNESDVVLDFTAGSFSTGIAAQNTGRRFIGIELDEKYFEIGKNRMIENLKRLESLTNNAS